MADATLSDGPLLRKKSVILSAFGTIFCLAAFFRDLLSQGRVSTTVVGSTHPMAFTARIEKGTFTLTLSNLARLLAPFVAVLLFALPVVAADEESLWGIVSPNIPDDAQAVLFVDAASLKASALMTRLKPLLLRMEHGAADDVERTCNIDLAAVVKSVILVVAHNEQVTFYVETRDLELKRLTDCITAMAAREHEQVKITSKGAIVQVASRSERIYFGWVKDRVLVVAAPFDKRERLTKALTKARRRFDTQPKVSTLLAGLDRAATAWGMYIDRRASRRSKKPELAFGSLNLVSGSMIAEVRALFSTAEKATEAEKELNRELAAAKQDAKSDPKTGGSVGAALLRLLEAVRIVATAREIVANATVEQRDIIDVVEAEAAKH